MMGLMDGDLDGLFDGNFDSTLLLLLEQDLDGLLVEYFDGNVLGLTEGDLDGHIDGDFEGILWNFFDRFDCFVIQIPYTFQSDTTLIVPTVSLFKANPSLASAIQNSLFVVPCLYTTNKLECWSPFSFAPLPTRAIVPKGMFVCRL
jgi:hypothetical protein